MKKFRFVGDASINEHILEYGRVYQGNLNVKEWDMSVKEAAYLYPDDWEKVTEHDTARIPNQDQPASSMTKFEMAVFMAMQGLCTDPNLDPKLGSEFAVKTATELFKKLEKLKK